MWRKWGDFGLHMILLGASLHLPTMIPMSHSNYLYLQCVYLGFSPLAPTLRDLKKCGQVLSLRKKVVVGTRVCVLVWVCCVHPCVQPVLM